MRKSVMIFLVIGLMLSGYFYVIDPLLAEREGLAVSLQSKYTTLKKYERFVTKEKTSEDDIRTAKMELEEMQKSIIEVSDESLAVGRIQAKIEDIVYESGIDIISVRARPSTSQSGYIIVPIEIESTADLSAIDELLQNMENARDHMRIQRMDINMAGLASEGPLRLRLIIEGLAKKI